MNNILKRMLAMMIALLLVLPAFAEEMTAPEAVETVILDAAYAGEAADDAELPEEIVAEGVDQAVEESAEADLTEALSTGEAPVEEASEPVAEVMDVIEAEAAEVAGEEAAETAGAEADAAGTFEAASDSAGTSTSETESAVSTVIPVEKIAFPKSKKKRTVKTMGKLYLGGKVKVTPATATTPLQWTSSNPAVAVVDSNGVVTGVSKGNVTITAEADGKIAKAKVNVKKNKTVVFFGDSLTHGGRWKPYFKKRQIVNMGVIGDSLAAMNARVGKVAAKFPTKVFILGGINSLILGSSEQALKDYEILIDNVQSQMSGVPIYLLSVLPVTVETERFGCTNAEVIELNKGIQELAAKRGLAYIDIYQYYVKDGSLNPKLTYDGLHLKKKAYKYWRKAIKPYV